MTTSKNDLPFYIMENDLIKSPNYETLNAILFGRLRTRLDKFVGKELTNEIAEEIEKETNNFLTEIIDLISQP